MGYSVPKTKEVRMLKSLIILTVSLFLLTHCGRNDGTHQEVVAETVTREAFATTTTTTTTTTTELVTTGTIKITSATPFLISANGEVVAGYPMGSYSLILVFKDATEHKNAISLGFGVNFGELMFLAQMADTQEVKSFRGKDLIPLIAKLSPTLKPFCADDMGKSMVSFGGFSIGVGIRRYGNSAFQASQPEINTAFSTTGLNFPTQCKGDGYVTCPVEGQTKSCPWFNCSGGCGQMQLWRNDSCDGWKVKYAGWCNRGIAELIPYCRCTEPQTNVH